MLDINAEALYKGKRIRELDNWFIRGYPAHDPKITIYQLVGWTVLEANGKKPPARVTRTSPIASCEGNIVTTASGSQYTLLNPDKHWVEANAYEMNPEHYIPEEFCNSWIDGNNWMTI